MTSIELITPERHDIPGLARIAFEAFRDIHDRHHSPRDFPDVETALKVVGLIAGLPGTFAVAARREGRLLGSNFLRISDGVGGVGPITIAPEVQGRGLGRRLMEAVLDHAAQNGIERVRLLQDSFNTASLSLYASLGFDVREPVAVMKAAPRAEADPSIRLAETSDAGAMDDLCRRHYKLSRAGEVADWFRMGLPVLLRENGGRICGYTIPGKLGHGVALSEADALALVAQFPRYAPPGMDEFFLPLRATSLYRAALRAGCRLVKVMTLMTRGPYEDPDGVWMPSILY